MCYFPMILQAAWTMSIALPAQVELPDGFEVVELRQSDFQIGYARMNDCGQVVFSEDFFGDLNGDIVLSDNGLSTRITNTPDEADWVCDISESGTVTWMIHGGIEIEDFEVRVLRGGQIESLGRGGSPAINIANHIAFQEIVDPWVCNFETHIQFYDGNQRRQITDGNLSNQSAKLNDLDEISWTEYTFCRSPWTGNIMLYSGGEFTVINEEEDSWQGPDINNAGHVVYTGPPGVFVWDGENTTRIAAGDTPDINNLGDVCYTFQEIPRVPDIYLARVEGEDRITYRLTDDPHSDHRCNTNDWGEAVWTAFLLDDGELTDFRLRLLRRIRTGDSEFDGDIDHDDLAKLVDCMTGPGWVERTDPGPEDSLCECRFLDINHDGSVDLRDYASFQQNFGQ